MNKMLLNNECATYLENVPQQIFQSTVNGGSMFNLPPFVPSYEIKLCYCYKCYNRYAYGQLPNSQKGRTFFCL